MSTWSRHAVEPADVARSLVPLGLLATAAAVPSVRLPILVIVAIGAAIAVGRAAPVRWTWAGAAPVALSLWYGSLPAPVAGADLVDCASPGSPVALWRIVEAVVVLLALVIAAVVLRASAATLSIRLPGRRWRWWALVGFIVAGPLALLLGPLLAAPFFGDVSYALVPAALVPALAFAAANAAMEELIYRGALLGWAARVIGPGPAIVAQAVVFGLAHAGPDVVGLHVPLMLAMGLGGLLAGVIVVRTRSLLVPLAIHVGLDVPIYYALACGSAGS